MAPPVDAGTFYGSSKCVMAPSGIAKFYFLVFQYIYEPDNDLLSNLLSSFKELYGELPCYLNDHCGLFINRIEKILKAPQSIAKEDIKTEALQKVWEMDSLIPRFVLRKMTAKLTIPRPDILDIIYAYSS